MLIRALKPAEAALDAQNNFGVKRDFGANQDRSPNPYSDLDFRNSAHVNLNLPSDHLVSQ